MLWTFGEGRSSAGAKGTDLHGNGLLNSPRSSYLQFVSFILGRANASPSNTQGGSPVRESRPPGSVRGASSNGCPYRDSFGNGPPRVTIRDAYRSAEALEQRQKHVTGTRPVSASVIVRL